MPTWSRTSRLWSFLALVLLCTPVRAWQAQEPPPPPEEEQPAPAEPQPPAPTEPRKPDEPELQPGLPSAEEQGEGPEEEEEGVETPRPPEERNLPRLDVYFPEGELDLRINRLINKVFFEGQVKYN
ncbi:MAG TPA: hypothetical protein VLT87_19625, partial [Thermoanaerobaculia bacterium]|nr:hypothetical protein [Thermoanaerobaculia bacterium]